MDSRTPFRNLAGKRHKPRHCQVDVISLFPSAIYQMLGRGSARYAFYTTQNPEAPDFVLHCKHNYEGYITKFLHTVKKTLFQMMRLFLVVVLCRVAERLLSYPFFDCSPKMKVGRFSKMETLLLESFQEEIYGVLLHLF